MNATDQEMDQSDPNTPDPALDNSNPNLDGHNGPDWYDLQLDFDSNKIRRSSCNFNGCTCPTYKRRDNGTSIMCVCRHTSVHHKQRLDCVGTLDDGSRCRCNNYEPHQDTGECETCGCTGEYHSTGRHFNKERIDSFSRPDFKTIAQTASQPISQPYPMVRPAVKAMESGQSTQLVQHASQQLLFVRQGNSAIQFSDYTKFTKSVTAQKEEHRKKAAGNGYGKKKIKGVGAPYVIVQTDPDQLLTIVLAKQTFKRDKITKQWTKTTKLDKYNHNILVKVPPTVVTVEALAPLIHEVLKKDETIKARLLLKNKSIKGGDAIYKDACTRIPKDMDFRSVMKGDHLWYHDEVLDDDQPPSDIEAALEDSLSTSTQLSRQSRSTVKKPKKRKATRVQSSDSDSSWDYAFRRRSLLSGHSRATSSTSTTRGSGDWILSAGGATSSTVSNGSVSNNSSGNGSQLSNTTGSGALLNVSSGIINSSTSLPNSIAADVETVRTNSRNSSLAVERGSDIGSIATAPPITPSGGFDDDNMDDITPNVSPGKKEFTTADLGTSLDNLLALHHISSDVKNMIRDNAVCGLSERQRADWLEKLLYDDTPTTKAKKVQTLYASNRRGPLSKKAAKSVKMTRPNPDGLDIQAAVALVEQLVPQFEEFEGNYVQNISPYFEKEAGGGVGVHNEWFRVLRSTMNKVAFEGQQKYRLPSMQLGDAGNPRFWDFGGASLGICAVNGQIAAVGASPRFLDMLYRGETVMSSKEPFEIEEAQDFDFQVLLKKLSASDPRKNAEVATVSEPLTTDEVTTLSDTIDGIGPRRNKTYFTFDKYIDKWVVNRDHIPEAIQSLLRHVVIDQRSTATALIATAFERVTQFSKFKRLATEKLTDPMWHHWFPAENIVLSKADLARCFVFRSDNTCPIMKPHFEKCLRQISKLLLDAWQRDEASVVLFCNLVMKKDASVVAPSLYRVQ